MKLSTRVRYGVRAMMDLAMHYEEGGPVVMRTVAARQDVSKKYLDNLFSVLRASGLVRSSRGAAGGYVLTRSPSEITLSNIVMALEGSLAIVDCIDDEKCCNRSQACATHCVWEEITSCIRRALEGVTLAELADRQRAIEAGARGGARVECE